MKEIVYNSEDSELSDDNSQSYDSDMSPENISRPISSESEEYDCSEAESDIQEQRGLILIEENE